MKGLALFIVEIVTFVVNNKVENRSFGEVRWFVNDELSLGDAGADAHKRHPTI